MGDDRAEHLGYFPILFLSGVTAGAIFVLEQYDAGCVASRCEVRPYLTTQSEGFDHLFGRELPIRGDGIYRCFRTCLRDLDKM
ncbi:hypothetical protein F4820DRAFT_446086 [Hypoxylon rubiginosum]|uniref:Uncharacterized protein n=1 Tax=Hypoxylon rubiginosum TaxID=110542 RepID=A0ACB9Z6Y1_9PEZI|nr:hypothetical protein F4820DRAFT_446086 [Hypoxylon rubiginosum]